MTVLSRRADNRLLVWLTAGVVLAGIALRLIIAEPTWLHWDENYYINIAQNFAAHGELTPYMWRLGQVNIIAGSGSGYGVVLLAMWLRLTGYSLFWGRLLMIALNLVTMLVLFVTARKWWGTRAAGLAAVIYAAASTHSTYTLVVRMDAFGALAYSLVLLLYITALHTDRNWLHGLVGVAAVVAAEFHILATIYLFALATLYAVQYVTDLLKERRFTLRHGAVWFGAGAFLSGVVYLLVHVLPDPEAYFIISRECFECNEPILTTEFKRVVRTLATRPEEQALALLVAAGALIRRKPDDRRYLILFGSWLVGQALIGPPPFPHYASHFYPVIALGVGGFFAHSEEVSRQQMITVATGAVALMLLAGNLFLFFRGNYPFVLAYSLTEKPAVQCVQATVPEDTVVMATVADFYPLRNYENFLSYRDGVLYGLHLRDETLLDFWHRIDPQVVILDETTLKDDTDLTTYFAEQEYHQVRDDLWITGDLYQQIGAEIAVQCVSG